MLQVPAGQGEDDHAERGGARHDHAEQEVGAEIRRGERVQHVRMEYREDPGPVGSQRDDAQDHASRAVADEQVAGVAFRRLDVLVGGGQLPLLSSHGLLLWSRLNLVMVRSAAKAAQASFRPRRFGEDEAARLAGLRAASAHAQAHRAQPLAVGGMAFPAVSAWKAMFPHNSTPSRIIKAGAGRNRCPPF